jgi:hypothetical protein
MRARASSLWAVLSLAAFAACSSTGADEIVDDLDAAPRRDAAAPPVDATSPATDSSVPAIDSSAPVVDSSVPALDAGSPVVDAGSPALDAGSPVVDAGQPVADTGAPVIDAGSPAVDSGAPRVDAGTPVIDAGTPVVDAGPTVAIGATCTGATTDCRLASPLAGYCSGSSPTPSCMATGCAITSPTAVDYCDSNRGICLSGGTSNYCVQKCAFGNSTAAPTGCTGVNTCNAYGFSRDTAGVVSGVGFCLGTCTATAECPTGFICQVETGVCTTSANYRTYTLAVGSTCTAGTTTTCNCLGRTGQSGVCTKACIVGRTGTCSTGFACSPDVPKTFSDGSTAFTATPNGLSGNCLKNCTVNADCPTGTYCDTNDTAGKVCKPNP